MKQITKKINKIYIKWNKVGRHLCRQVGGRNSPLPRGPKGNPWELKETWGSAGYPEGPQGIPPGAPRGPQGISGSPRDSKGPQGTKGTQGPQGPQHASLDTRALSHTGAEWAGGVTR